MRLRIYSFFLLPFLLLGCDGALNDIHGKNKTDHNNEKEETLHHHIILDAGSATTSLYLYEYNSEKKELATNIEIISFITQSPGIADIQTSQIPAYLSKLFNNDLLEKITQASKKHHSATPKLIQGIQFYSTAGMRELAYSERADKNTAINDWLVKWAKDKSVHLNNAIDVKTITGKEEGAYSWAAYNYISHQFKEELEGILALGGASTQIAYQDKNLNNASITIGGKAYPVYSQSYPLGLKVVQAALKNVDECHLLDYSETSRGDYHLCRETAKAFISRTMGDAYQGNQYVNEFGLLTEFYNHAQFFDLKQNYSFKNLQDKAEQFCSLDWENAKTTYRHYDPEYMEPFCMMTAFQGALLEDNYHLSDKHKFHPIQKVNNTKISWPMGLLITQQYQE
ncbi:hypothetical protein [Shewanella surugensis]|uniref:Uncharacterized protein n=1 Tax=Shewanella surugensis TaxID=212020 RepID=A0ABT0L9D8_9GAMM|nr:hypothetical protein [Shewanella surugensis]MCL1124313.1 hypothetical protein [Shewanella surugensis]